MSSCFVIIIKCWLKLLTCDDCKFIKYMYKMMKLDLAEWSNKVNWAWLVKDMSAKMGIYEV